MAVRWDWRIRVGLGQGFYGPVLAGSPFYSFWTSWWLSQTIAAAYLNALDPNSLIGVVHQSPNPHFFTSAENLLSLRNGFHFGSTGKKIRCTSRASNACSRDSNAFAVSFMP